MEQWYKFQQPWAHETVPWTSWWYLSIDQPPWPMYRLSWPRAKNQLITTTICPHGSIHWTSWDNYEANKAYQHHLSRHILQSYLLKIQKFTRPLGWNNTMWVGIEGIPKSDKLWFGMVLKLWVEGWSMVWVLRISLGFGLLGLEDLNVRRRIVMPFGFRFVSFYRLICIDVRVQGDDLLLHQMIL